ncbi:MAG: hypothetical protein GY700_11125 [Propionibacteriaceae bacterium]|nr:hypothetical protein [Propionibacteriaceae bacterium]
MARLRWQYAERLDEDEIHVNEPRTALDGNLDLVGAPCVFLMRCRSTRMMLYGTKPNEIRDVAQGPTVVHRKRGAKAGDERARVLHLDTVRRWNPYH